MPEIYDSFTDIANKFDVLLVDAYGVFWNGRAFYDGSREMLASQVDEGKKVIILSNTTALSPDAMASYAKKGLERGKHYTDFITSGDVAHNAFLNDNIEISGHKIYMQGTPNFKIFENTPFTLADFPEQADAFYISVPQLTEEQAAEHDLYEKNLYRSPKGLFDSTAIEPFIPALKKMYRMGLPAINANPDLRASEKDEFGDVHFVIRQGSIAEAYRKMGGRVIEFGKPHSNIFDYARKTCNIPLTASTAMIGDTYRTDIKGAQNSGISGVWCIETGITAEEISAGKTPEQLCGGNFENTFLIKKLGTDLQKNILMNKLSGKTY